jgi:hypothetical protein
MWLLIVPSPQVSCYPVCPRHKYVAYTLFSNTLSLCGLALDGWGNKFDLEKQA